MRKKFASFLVFMLLSLHASASTNDNLLYKKWSHGAADCALDEQPNVDIFSHDNNTFILRQNKCDSFEAPFIYILEGDSSILIFDTGAIEDKDTFDFNDILKDIFSQKLTTKSLLVVHSHGHSDHIAGDEQLSTLENMRFIDTTKSTEIQTLDLGKRTVKLIPSPGHHEQAIALYDESTQWLLTGDTLYPGMIYVKDWLDYRESIAALADFSLSHPVSAILGGHIETDKLTGDIYPIGSTYQPNEAPLLLMLSELTALNTILKDAEQPKEIKQGAVIVMPMNFLQRSLVNIVNFFKS